MKRVNMRYYDIYVGGVPVAFNVPGPHLGAILEQYRGQYPDKDLLVVPVANGKN